MPLVVTASWCHTRAHGTLGAELAARICDGLRLPAVDKHEEFAALGGGPEYCRVLQDRRVSICRFLEIEEFGFVVQTVIDDFDVELVDGGLDGIADGVALRDAQLDRKLNLHALVGHDAQRDLNAVILLE